MNTSNWSTQYWRYERLGFTDNIGDGQYREAIFKVSMDEDILEVLDTENVTFLAFGAGGDRGKAEASSPVAGFQNLNV